MKYYKSKMYQFLLPYIEQGASDELLQTKRQEWKKKQKADSQRKKRAEEKQFTISLSKDQLRIINRAAKGHKMSKTKFIKQSALAYCTQTFLVLDSEVLLDIKEHLMMNYSLLQQHIEQEFSDELRKETLEKIDQMIKKVLNAIQSPKEITNWLNEHKVPVLEETH